MGSQSVTDFSAARKERIQRQLRAFEPQAEHSAGRARLAGVEAMGSLAPSSQFVQALTSASVDHAAKTLARLIADLKATGSDREIATVLGKYGVRAGEPRPYVPLVAGLRRSLEEELSASSSKSEAAPAAADAMGRTLLDAIARASPGLSEPSDASSRTLVGAIRRTTEPQFTTLFLRNVINALLEQTFDAARGAIPRAKVEALFNQLGPALTNKLAAQLIRPDARLDRIKDRLTRDSED